MPTTITTRDERVFKEIKRLCYAGLDPETLIDRAARRLRSAVPFAGYSMGTLDPVSHLPTSVHMGGIQYSAEETRFFLEHIYFDDDVSDYGWMARNRVPALPLSEATDGRLAKALRHREFNAPIKGFRYELRAAFTAGGILWGGMCLVRERNEPDFSEREVVLIRRAAPHLGAGLRAATLRQRADRAPSRPGAAGVLVLDERWRVTRHTSAADSLLRELDDLVLPGSERWREGKGLPTAVWSAAMSLRRALRSEQEDHPPDVPLVHAFGSSGRWLTLQASLTEDAPGHPAETVIVISPAEPQEAFRLRKSTYGLSPREAEIADLVVRGLSTREISRALYISEYTVQDHLKHVFGKIGVKSRREVVKRLFLDNLPG